MIGTNWHLWKLVDNIQQNTSCILKRLCFQQRYRQNRMCIPASPCQSRMRLVDKRNNQLM